MAHKLEDFIEKTRRATTTDGVKNLLARALNGEGYDNLVFASTRNRGLHEIVWADFPPGYVEAYRDHGWDRIDPVLEHAQRARRPFSWAEVTHPSTLTAEQRAFLDDCRAIGVHSGLTVPLHAPGQQVDLISVSLRNEREAPIARAPFVYALAVQAWLRHGELAAPSDKADAPLLTGRELECLKWVKDGKTNWEIGKILSIAERTVEFHLTNVMQKLGASNRIMAVVVAIQLGLLKL
ncbi:MAG TPA: autoinducer binding domain-containing protein [Beijerinckiaceae bacterium]|jgi:DNA-binding CsgD family transcriptional regulator